MCKIKKKSGKWIEIQIYGGCGFFKFATNQHQLRRCRGVDSSINEMLKTPETFVHVHRF